MKHIYILSAPLWLRASLAILSNFVGEKITSRVICLNCFVFGFRLPFEITCLHFACFSITMILSCSVKHPPCFILASSFLSKYISAQLVCYYFETCVIVVECSLLCHEVPFPVDSYQKIEKWCMPFPCCTLGKSVRAKIQCYQLASPQL